MKGLGEVLAEHMQQHRPTFGDATCSCGGWIGPMTTLPRGDKRSHAAHVEAVVLDWLRERLAGAREGVAVTLLGTRDPAGPLPVVRAGCGQPAADAALTAVAEALGVGEVRA